MNGIGPHASHGLLNVVCLIQHLTSIDRANMASQVVIDKDVLDGALKMRRVCAVCIGRFYQWGIIRIFLKPQASTRISLHTASKTIVI